MVDQGATLGWTAAPVLTDPTAVVFVATAPSDQTTQDCSAISSIQCTDLDFHANFTNISAVQNGIADLSSTFRFTARAGLNGTVVQCMAATESGVPRANQSLIVAGKVYILPSITTWYHYVWFLGVEFWDIETTLLLCSNSLLSCGYSFTVLHYTSITS